MQPNDYGDVFRHTAAGVIAVDTGGRIVAMNAAAESLTGWTTQQSVGKPWSEILDFPEGLSILSGKGRSAPPAADEQEAPMTMRGHVTTKNGESLAEKLQEHLAGGAPRYQCRTRRQGGSLAGTSHAHRGCGRIGGFDGTSGRASVPGI